MCRTLGRRRWSGRRDREPERLAHFARAGRLRHRPRNVQERLGGAPAAVHAGQDDPGPLRPRRDVLQGIPRHVRLAAQRRGAHRLRSPGTVRSERPRVSKPRPPLRRLLSRRGSGRPKLRSAAQDYPQHVQRQPRTPLAQGDRPRLGRRPDPGRTPLQSPAWRKELPADAGALREIQRHRRRQSHQPRGDLARLQRLRADPRGKIQELACRLRRCLGQSDAAQRRHHPLQRGPRRRDRQRGRRQVVRRSVRMGIHRPQPRDRTNGQPQSAPSRPDRFRKRPPSHRGRKVHRRLADDDRERQRARPTHEPADDVPHHVRRQGLVRLHPRQILARGASRSGTGR